MVGMEALRLAKILKIRQHVPCSLFRIVVLLEVIAFHLIKPFKSCILILQEKMSILDNLPIWISLGVKCQCPIIAYMFNADCLFPLKYSFCSNSMNSYYYRHDVNDPQFNNIQLKYKHLLSPSHNYDYLCSVLFTRQILMYLSFPLEN